MIRLSLEQITSAIEDQNGFCRACGNEQNGVEPDARNYICETCGQPEVFGAEELVLMGEVS